MGIAVSCKYKGCVLEVSDSLCENTGKPIIDQVDKVLAMYFGFTDEELDFIINYDIKYRMGDLLFADAE
jgi:hypothetical protein